MHRTLLIWLLSTWCAQAGLSKLDALSMIETGNNDWVVGAAGEVSRYQIKPCIWRCYSASSAYRNVEVAARVAARHLAHLEAGFFRSMGREPTDFDCYVLWNAGLSYYKKVCFSPARVHPVIRERAKRFANLRQASYRSSPSRL